MVQRGQFIGKTLILHIITTFNPSAMKPKAYKKNDKASDTADEPFAPYGNPPIYLDPTKRYSYADYRTWTDNKMRELIDGFVSVMSGPNLLHSVSSGNIFGKIWSHIEKRKGKCKIIHAPFDVRLPKNGETADNKIYTVVQPDIIVVCNPEKLDERGCMGAPDLVVEVQSPSTARLDMSKKFDLYEEAGVKEYWVVYPKAGLTVFLLQENGRYDDGTTYDVAFTPDAKVPVHTIEGLELGLKDLFKD